MKVILLQDDKNLGRKGTIVDVSDGFATSSLIPSGKARVATVDIMTQLRRIQRNKKEFFDKKKKCAEDNAQALRGKTIHITAQAEGVKLFGSIGPKEVAQAIKKEYNVTIDDNSVEIGHIKTVGPQKITLNLGHGVRISLMLTVQAL